MDETEIGRQPTKTSIIAQLILELAALAFVAWLIYMIWFR
jgi:hypothetical protein